MDPTKIVDWLLLIGIVCAVTPLVVIMWWLCIYIIFMGYKF